ncbi:hypothetical protein CONCODRAFT_71770 [Conidiobolus coronatus NRRL 28638]|uniref:G-protein coupled receptors family 1 profile domain-containing protein n=1 Tax=Conidiobolus coronatus (strain ATCC 28846 / CBS 209.66 / NRRL 28638) TaxID=796925 RepID=A0A137P2E2_CONC2|nr:hypothetical protein CONCODRAFT_71770 [Conidiobolus coronatus NRRL 28638]|eukprot:KXN69081.1 hypothetical protein CONCODRAFT_71770 [Conidiobolus coronatus NRRL 28638]
MTFSLSLDPYNVKPSDIEVYHEIWPNPWVMPIFMLLIGSIAFLLGFPILFVVHKYFRKELHIDLQMGLFMVALDTASSLGIAFGGLLNLPPLNLMVKYHSLCIIQVFCVSTTLVTSMLIMGVIALERCLLIVYNIKLEDKVYWIIISVCLSIAVANDLMVVCTDSIGLQPSGGMCHYSVNTRYGRAAYIIMLFTSAGSFCVLIVSYCKIVYNRHVTSRREQLALGLDPAKVKRETNRTTVKLLSILVINLVTNLPYVITQIVGLFDPTYYTPRVAFFTVPFLVLSLWWNSVIYLGLNEKIYIKLKETVNEWRAKYVRNHLDRLNISL